MSVGCTRCGTCFIVAVCATYSGVERCQHTASRVVELAGVTVIPRCRQRREPSGVRWVREVTCCSLGPLIVHAVEVEKRQVEAHSDATVLRHAAPCTSRLRAATRVVAVWLPHRGYEIPPFQCKRNHDTQARMNAAPLSTAPAMTAATMLRPTAHPAAYAKVRCRRNLAQHRRSAAAGAR